MGSAFYRDAFYVFILKLFTNKIVFHLHGQGIKAGSKRSKVSEYIYKWVFKNSNVICLGRNLINDLDGIYNGTPYIVPNGLFREANIPTNITKNSVPIILFLSNYKVLKGVLLLIDVLQSMKAKGEIFAARLVGSPGDLSITDLEIYIKNKGIEECVQVVGPLYGEDKKLEFLKADVFVFPTLFEAFGIVNLEAMQYSLPIVSTNEGAIPDIIIDGETGFLITPGNKEQLQNKLELLIKNPKLRQKMGAQGRMRYYDFFTEQQFENNLRSVFESILSGNVISSKIEEKSIDNPNLTNAEAVINN